jgi:hypothetical protein
MARSSRIPVLIGVICLLGVIVFLIQQKPSPPLPGPQTSEEAASANGRRPGGKGAAPSGAIRTARMEEAEGDPLIEGVLRDTAIGDDEAARKLLALAKAKEESVQRRLEALKHAVLLTDGAEEKGLVELAQDKSLPVALAQELLDDFYRREDPTRLAGALALAKNDDASVREDAMELLRFLMDEGEGEEGTDVEVLEKAESRLPPQERE